MELANGDAKELLRFQNKYRELVKKQNNNKLEFSQKNIKNTKKITKNAEKTEFFDKKLNFNEYLNNSSNQNHSENVISFPVEQKLFPQHLSEAEIQSLFVGLAKLVKKSALAEMEEKLNQEREKLSVVVRKSTVEIGQKAEKIDELLTENKKLSKQIVMLKQKLEEMRSSFVKV